MKEKEPNQTNRTSIDVIDIAKFQFSKGYEDQDTQKIDLTDIMKNKYTMACFSSDIASGLVVNIKTYFPTEKGRDAMAEYYSIPAVLRKEILSGSNKDVIDEFKTTESLVGNLLQINNVKIEDDSNAFSIFADALRNNKLPHDDITTLNVARLTEQVANSFAKGIVQEGVYVDPNSNSKVEFECHIGNVIKLMNTHRYQSDQYKQTK